MEEEIIDMYVEIRSDGTVQSFDEDRKIVPLHTDLFSWTILHNIVRMANMCSTERKGKPKLESTKYIQFSFVNVLDNTKTILPLSHVECMCNSIIKQQ